MKTNSANGYLVSLEISNLRSFGKDEQVLSFVGPDRHWAQWTVILGENGVGKSTILELLAFNSRRPQDWDIADLRHYVRTTSTKAAIARFVLKFVKSVRRPWSGQLKLPQATLKSRFTRRGFLDANPIDDDVPIVYAYGATRRTGFTSIQESEAGSPVATLFDERADLINAEEWILRRDYSSLRSGSSRSAKNELSLAKKLLIDALPDVTDIKVDREPLGDLPVVLFKNRDGWVSIRNLGFGYRSTIAWLVDFVTRMVSRYPTSKNPLAELAIVLVDEIDLHLHPTWQRKLMDHLSKTFPRTQFIVSAHSPLFAQAAQNANLVLLKRDTATGSVRILQGEDQLPNIANWRIDQILTSDLFGLATSRPPQIEPLIKTRHKILSKSELSPTDRKRLSKIDERIGYLPGGETPHERQTLELVEQTLKQLESSLES